MEILIKLFGSKQRIHLMRLFFMHKDELFSFEDIQSKTKIRKETLKKDLLWLLSCEVIKKQNKKITTPRGAKKVIQVYILNIKNPFTHELYNMLAARGENEVSLLKARFKKAGKIDLIIASGFFIQNADARVDLLVVGKNLKKTLLEKEIALIESEIGKELQYGFFETEDFLYRAHMYDKLIRDVIDFPHIKVVDAGVLSKIPKMS